MNENPGIINFWELVKKIARELDVMVTREHRWSSADICFIEQGKEMLDGFGPVGLQQQEKSEYILRHSLLERSALLAVTLKEISGPVPPGHHDNTNL